MKFEMKHLMLVFGAITSLLPIGLLAGFMIVNEPALISLEVIGWFLALVLGPLTGGFILGSEWTAHKITNQLKEALDESGWTEILKKEKLK